MSSQNVPSASDPSNSPKELVRAAGFEPAAINRSFLLGFDVAPLPPTEPAAAAIAAVENRPQSVPITQELARRLTRSDLRYLVGLCQREAAAWGLQQEPGIRAAELRDRLTEIHNHGFESQLQPPINT